MSNQFGLILSFLFLSFFIILSGELIALDKVSAQAMSYTESIAFYFETEEWDYYDAMSREDYQFFDQVFIDYQGNENGYGKFILVTKKDYKSFSNLFSNLNQEIKCKMIVYRKE